MKLLRWMVVGAVVAMVTLGFLRRYGRSAEELSDLTRAELYRRAQTAGLEGRSQMNKAQLIEALRSAS